MKRLVAQSNQHWDGSNVPEQQKYCSCRKCSRLYFLSPEMRVGLVPNSNYFSYLQANHHILSQSRYRSIYFQSVKIRVILAYMQVLLKFLLTPISFKVTQLACLALLTAPTITSGVSEYYTGMFCTQLSQKFLFSNKLIAITVFLKIVKSFCAHFSRCKSSVDVFLTSGTLLFSFIKLSQAN